MTCIGEPGCPHPVRARKLCNTHLNQWYDRGETWPIGTRRNHSGRPHRIGRPVDVAEDVEFLASAGENVEGITGRIGYAKTESLYRALLRAERLDLWRSITGKVAA